ncbi:Tellurite resistance protein TehB [Gracilaria domingensis]|nr:Tellurite resistance protein TehB [Gracilaria domingensis]
MGLSNSHKSSGPVSDKSQWLSAFSDLPVHQKPPFIDIRCETDFERGHVAHSSNFPFSGEGGVGFRTNELPAVSGQPQLAIYGDQEQCNQVAEQLHRRGYPEPILLTKDDISNFPRAQGPSRALWSPATIVAEEMSRLLSHPIRTALDIGCGSGRDAAFLASIGFSVNAVDRDSKLTEKATKLWKRNQYHPLVPSPNSATGSVRTMTRTFGANLADDREFLRRHAAGVLVVVRFLRRGVLELLRHGVQPGGLVVYEHFLTGCERFGSPAKPSQMLRRGELGEIFGAAQKFTILRDEECTLGDGRPVVRFVAVKRV